MKYILNLTQHAASSEQVDAGVVELEEERQNLNELLTFDDIPSSEEIVRRAAIIANMAMIAMIEYRFLAVDYDNVEMPEITCSAMIGGALWLMAPLAAMLRERGITPLFAFSKRESREEDLPDGSVQKVSVFKHAGFIPAI